MIPTIPTDLAVLPQDQQWPEQGAWTYDDYLRLPDDGRRYEIIKGVLYVTNAPSYAHQYAVSQILVALSTFVAKRELGTVLTAPFEVHLSEDAKPVLPDIVYITREQQLDVEAPFFTGAPKLIVEVLSPSTRRYDQSIKMDVYERAGVQEYWLVDPIARFVTIYYLPQDGREYILLGEFTQTDTLTSNLFAGLTIEVASLFPPK